MIIKQECTKGAERKEEKGGGGGGGEHCSAKQNLWRKVILKSERCNQFTATAMSSFSPNKRLQYVHTRPLPRRVTLFHSPFLGF